MEEIYSLYQNESELIVLLFWTALIFPSRGTGVSEFSTDIGCFLVGTREELIMGTLH